MNTTKIIGCSFLTSFTFFLFFSMIYYNSSEGFEKRQGDFLMILSSFFILIVEMLLSLLGYLNSFEKINKTKLLSIGSFILLPITSICIFSFYNCSISDSKVIYNFEIIMNLIISLGTILVYLISLIVFSFIYHRKNWL